MQKIVLSFFLIFLVEGLTSPCNSQVKQSWTSMNPLSVPITLRESYYKKGNLVPNSSFEQCEIFKNDSTITNFKLLNWNVIGNNVQLTDITRKGVYDSMDVFQGEHAIKIIRKADDVKEIDNKPYGVESDFIKVIPANYDFHFDIRLKNIISSSYPDRFQRRIGKGIDIRVKFYDKNKEEIPSGMYFEYVDQKIDNGYKGYAFSNYFYIHKFDWGKVRGETWHYPFSEGDLPDGCRYIKIFLGLSCMGTMWIDNIDFHLSKWNFTPMARMDSFFHKKYDLVDLMVPTPQKISNKQSISLMDRDIILICGDTSSPEIRMALKLLQKKLTEINGSIPKVQKSTIQSSSKKLQIVFINPGQAPSSKFDDAFEAIKGKKQGYFIKKVANEIYLGANQPEGWFYATSSLLQLIDYKKKVLYYADVTDYPDFTGRTARLFNYNNKWALEQNKSLSDSAITQKLQSRYDKLEQQLKDIDFYARFKINYLYSVYFILSHRWWRPGKFYNKYFNTIGSYCSKYGDLMNLAVQINPYFHIAMEYREDELTDSLRKLFSHGSEKSFEKIINTLKPALDAGARTVMFCADDYVPHKGILRGEYSLFTKSDKRQFTNLAAAQGYLLNKLRSWLDENYGEVRLEFVPPNYNNWFIDYSRGTAQVYFDDLNRHLDSSIVLVWTGSVIRSLSYDMADIHRVSKLYNQKPMIWDNSPYARALESKNGGYPVNYPEKSVLCNLFEPFDIEYPRDFKSYLNSHYYSNNGGSGEINKIKNLTFADFAWNTRDYNPDFSLFKVLVNLFGKDNAMLLLKFNDSYFKFVSTWGKLKWSIEHHSVSTLNEKNAQTQIDEMKDAFIDLQVIDNSNLKTELKGIMDKKIEEYNILMDRSKELK